MTFYLKPPGGKIPLHRLLGMAATRMNFLLKCQDLQESEDELEHFLTLCSSVEDSECLIEGSVKDRISHFIVRLSCLSMEEMTSFFTEAESILFKLRVKSMSDSDLLSMCYELKRHSVELLSQKRSSSPLKRQDKVFQSLGVLHSVSQQLKELLKQRGAASIHPKSFINANMTQHYEVPFQYILPLVASRTVNLKLGIGLVPIDNVNALLEALFRQHLTCAIEELKQTVESRGLFEADARLKDVQEDIARIFVAHKKLHSTNYPTSVRPILHTDVDLESTFFPPCMRFLHAQLRHSHRLNHLSRIQYSLYLKEIGLNVEEALQFWQNEYSKPLGNCTQKNPVVCNHNWQLHKNRYRYNIRHLYGLEGSRRKYYTHSCQHMQDRVLGALEETGCTFKHFDVDELQIYLRNIDVSDSDSKIIVSIMKEESPSLACNYYLNSRLKHANTGQVSMCDVTSLTTMTIDSSSKMILPLMPSTSQDSICDMTELQTLSDSRKITTPSSINSSSSSDMAVSSTLSSSQTSRSSASSDTHDRDKRYYLSQPMSKNKLNNFEKGKRILLPFSRPSEFYFALRGRFSRRD